jgi:hypothetical protein
LPPDLPAALYPQSRDWPPAVTDVRDVALDADSVRLTTGAKNLAHLARLPNLRRLWAFTINQAKLDQLADLERLEELHADGLRAADFGGLAKLRRLKILHLDRNGQATSLDWVERLPSLLALGIFGFIGVQDLSPLRAQPGLEALAVAGSMWTRMNVDTLAPLASLKSLRHLDLTNLKVRDESLEPLAGLTRLESLRIANFYPAAAFARLARALPTTECPWFRPVQPLDGVACQRCGGALVVLSGRGAPTKCTVCDDARIAKHIAEFDRIAGRSRESGASSTR